MKKSKTKVFKNHGSGIQKSSSTKEETKEDKQNLMRNINIPSNKQVFNFDIPSYNAGFKKKKKKHTKNNSSDEEEFEEMSHKKLMKYIQ